tara:strand:- start:54 stop:209 length:156 start_codon:yes stop_codon:yes gene_type:complete
MDYSDLKIDQKNNEPDISDSENISFQLSLMIRLILYQKIQILKQKKLFLKK